MEVPKHRMITIDIIVISSSVMRNIKFTLMIIIIITIVVGMISITIVMTCGLSYYC